MRRPVLLGLGLVLMACSSDANVAPGGDGSTSGAGGTGVTAGGGDGAAGHSGTAGVGASGGTGFGGVGGTSGTGGAGAQGGGGDGGQPSIECGLRELVVDGAGIDAVYDLDRIRFQQGLSHWQLVVSGAAFLDVFGTVPEASLGSEYIENAFEPGATLQLDSSLLYVPRDDPALPGTFYCAGNGSTWTTGQSHSIQLADVTELGGCNGVAVGGQLDGCFDVVFDECTALNGSLDGTAVTSDVWRGAASGNSTFLTYDDGTIIKMERNDGAGQGSLAYALVATPLDGPHAGAVYCSASGSTWVEEQGGFSLANLVRVGRCANVSDADMVSICARER